jgi:hypothetical protein
VIPHMSGSGIPATFYAGVLISMRREAITANVATLPVLDTGTDGQWRRWNAHDIVRERKRPREWWVVVRVDNERGIVGRHQDRARSEWINAPRCNLLVRIPDVELGVEQVEAAYTAAAQTLARYLGRELTDDDMAEAYRMIAGYTQRVSMRRPVIEE